MGRKPTRLLNRFRSISSYAKRETVITHFPTEVWIEPTSACNLKCVMCPRLDFPDDNIDGLMKWETFTRIVDEIASYDPNVMLFLSGEPLLHKQCMKMIGYAVDHGLTIWLNTNATLLNRQKAEQLLETGLQYLTFSFDGYTPDVFERIRVNANYDEVMSNILGFLELKKSQRKTDPFVTVYTLLLDPGQNTRQQEIDFLNIFNGLPVDRFLTNTPWNSAGKTPAEDGVWIAPGEGEFSPCYRPWNHIAINWKGEVVPCCIDYAEAMPMGNVRQRSIMEILNGVAFQKLRKDMSSGNLESYPLCAICDEIKPSGSVAGVPAAMFKGFKTDLLNLLLPQKQVMALKRIKFRKKFTS
jgi:MoaA/NifB/PqqE/SkfB family radical SAM enzyme